MKLTNKLRTGVLATTLTGLIGCAEFEETFKESGLDEIIWQAGAAKARKEGRYEDAQALENIGFIRGNIAAARAGRSEVNVNVNTNRDRRTQQLPDNVILSSNGNYSPAQGYTWINPKDNKDLRVRKEQQIPENVIVLSNGMRRPAQGYVWANPKNRDDLRVRKIQSANSVKQSIVDEDFKNSFAGSKGQFYIFAANYYKDFNENGYIGPKEYVGIKDTFRDDENIILVHYDNRNLKSELKMEVYGPSGEIIYTWKKDVHKSPVIENLNWTYGEEGYGNYKAVWKLDGKYDGSTEFEIVPSLKNKEAAKE